LLREAIVTDIPLLEQIRLRVEKLYALANTCAANLHSWPTDRKDVREYLTFLDAHFPGKDILALIRMIDELHGVIHDMMLDSEAMRLGEQRAYRKVLIALQKSFDYQSKSTDHPSNRVRLARLLLITEIKATICGFAGVGMQDQPRQLPPDALRAENARLRKAMQDILSLPLDGPVSQMIGVGAEAKNIANKALDK
jgi:hypothetical protein